MGRLRQFLQVAVESRSNVFHDRGRRPIDDNWGGSEYTQSRPVGMRLSVSRQKSRGWLHVIIQKDEHLARRREDPHITRCGPAAIGLPDTPEIKRRRELIDHLARTIRRTVDRYDDLKTVGEKSLPCQSSKRPDDRRATLVGRDNDADRG